MAKDCANNYAVELKDPLEFAKSVMETTDAESGTISGMQKPEEVRMRKKRSRA